MSEDAKEQGDGRKWEGEKHVPSSSAIEIVVILNGPTEAPPAVVNRLSDHRNTSVSSRAIVSSCTRKVTGIAVSLGPNVISWSILAPFCRAG